MENTSSEFALGIQYHLSPLTLIYQAIMQLPNLAIPLYLIFNNKDTSEAIYFVIFAILTLISVPAIILRWYYFNYTLTDNEIIINSGVLSKQTRHIPYSKIHNVNTTQNFLQKIFRIASVKIETAGDSATEGVLNYLSVENSEVIKQQLNQLSSSASRYSQSSSNINDHGNFQKNSQINGNEIIEKKITDELQEISTEPETISNNYSTPKENEKIKDNAENIIFALTNKELAKFAAIRARPIFLVFAFWVFNLYNQFSLFGGGDFLQDIEDNYSGSFDSVSLTEQIFIITGSLFLIFLISWVMDFLVTFNSFYGFQLKMENLKLYLKSGLLNSVQSTIPIKKIQMIQIKTNKIKEYFNYNSLLLDTAGVTANKQSSSEMVVPFAKYQDILSILGNFIKFETEFIASKISEKMINRRTIKFAIFDIILTSIVVPFTSYYFFLLLLFVPIMYLYNLYYYNSFSYFNNIDYILIRFGVFFKKQIIIPIDKIQSVTITNNYFQRRLGLSNLIIDTAASDNMSDASIPDMDSEDCNRLYKEINNILREKLKKKICIRGISDT